MDYFLECCPSTICSSYQLMSRQRSKTATIYLSFLSVMSNEHKIKLMAVAVFIRIQLQGKYSNSWTVHSPLKSVLLWGGFKGIVSYREFLLFSCFLFCTLVTTVGLCFELFPWLWETFMAFTLSVSQNPNKTGNNVL